MLTHEKYSLTQHTFSTQYNVLIYIMKKYHLIQIPTKLSVLLNGACKIEYQLSVGGPWIFQ